MPILIENFKPPGIAIEPVISVVMPVYNQETIISKVLENLMKNMTLPYELLLLDDASSDSTLGKIKEVFSNILIQEHQNLCHVRIYRNKISKFETYCDHFLFERSNSEFILELQADMIINDYGFDSRMLSAMSQQEKLCILSGRGVENFESVLNLYMNSLGTDRAQVRSLFLYLVLRMLSQMKYFLRFRRNNSEANQANSVATSTPTFMEVSDSDFLKYGNAGRLGQSIENKISHQVLQEKKLYLGDTVMRGPLLVRRNLYQGLGGFDKNSYFQGFDEHDLCARAKRKAYSVGYTPVDFESPPTLGTTRKRRSLKTEILIVANIIRISKSKRGSGLFKLQSLDLTQIAGQRKIIELT